MEYKNKFNLIRYKLLLIAGLIGSTIIGSANCVADSTQKIGNVTVYREVPNAYELAKTLFPPKTRTIVLDHESSPKTKPASIAFMVNFELDSVVVKDDSRPYLDALGDMLNFSQLKGKSLKIEGHADASGDEQYNLQLSEARAQSIKRYLESVHRIESDRLITLGYGESRLLDSARPYAEVNRRAEFSAWQATVN